MCRKEKETITVCEETTDIEVVEAEMTEGATMMGNLPIIQKRICGNKINAGTREKGKETEDTMNQVIEIKKDIDNQ